MKHLNSYIFPIQLPELLVGNSFFKVFKQSANSIGVQFTPVRVERKQILKDPGKLRFLLLPVRSHTVKPK